jgi:pimeloyl-ACP methyl ester carboxylesterase
MASMNDPRSGTLILLLHGLGTTGAVWHGVERKLAERGEVTILAPDLPGHGGSGADAPYTVERLAAAVSRGLPPHERLIAVGHSLGAYVALALGSGAFGVSPAALLSIGAKLNFSQAERARAVDLAAKPVRWFATRAEAEQRYRLVAGLPAAHFAQPWCIERGVVSGEGGFRLASDPAVFGIGVPPFADLLAAIRCPARIARGEHDEIVSREEIAALGCTTEDLAGLGHNAQVEDPARVVRLIDEAMAPLR